MSIIRFHHDKLEMSRRALIADLGVTLSEQPEFRRHAELASADMPLDLAWAIHRRGWIIEPAGGDSALELARRYGQGTRRRRILAVFLREAAAALQFVPSEIPNPHEWAETMLMNVGSIAYTPDGRAAGMTRRPSRPTLEKRDRGCRAIAYRGASRCIVCGTPVRPTPVGGAVVDRAYQPLACTDHHEATTRYYIDAMASVFDRCEWLLAEAMPLRVDMLARC